MLPVGRRSELVGVVSRGTHREILSMAHGRASARISERRCVDATHPVCERDSAGLLQVANRSRPPCIES
jgi:hypothetical protein